MSKKPIRLYSNPTEVYRLSKKYLGKTSKFVNFNLIITIL